MMKKKEIMDWLISWFESNSIVEGQEIRKMTSSSYFEAGIIDSFIFIQLIEDIEKKFEIEFGNEQFEDRSFATIEGLAEIIERSLT